MWIMKHALIHARYHKRQARKLLGDLQTASSTHPYLSQRAICGLPSSKGYLHHSSFLIVVVRAHVLVIVVLFFRRGHSLRLPCPALRSPSLARGFTRLWL